MRGVLWLVLCALGGLWACSDDDAVSALDVGLIDVGFADASECFDAEADAVTDVEAPGARAVEGEAYFFEAAGSDIGSVSRVLDVEGAVVTVLEYPDVAVVIGVDGRFRIEGLHAGREVTLGVTHPDFQPTLTATFVMGERDLGGVSFQVVSHTIARFLAAIVHSDINDLDHCNMVTTVTAQGERQFDVYAPGEPEVTVTLAPDPGPDSEGVVYFNTQVIPDRALGATTTDGGAIVANAQPGTYVWRGEKGGVVLNELVLQCVPGWLTNASPPYGMTVDGWPEL